MAAPAQSRQTEYYDNITFRKILAKSTINSVLPPFQVFTSDGQGGTYWSTLSSPNAYLSAFQYISTPAGIYVADASFNTFRFKAGTGLAFSTSRGNSTVLYGKAFENLQVPLQAKLVSSSIAFSSFGMIDIQTNTNSNLLSMNIIYPSLIALSTVLPLNDTTSTLNISGTREIQITESPTDIQVSGFSISTFTSESYLSTQNYVSVTAQTLYPDMVPFYLLQTEFSSALSNLSTTLTTRNIVYNSTSIIIMSSVVSSLNNYSTFFVNSISSYVNTVIPNEITQSNSIVNSISTFSSLLGQRMEPQTIASTTNIFGKAFYELNKSYISNNIYYLPELVSSVSTQQGIFFSSCATEAQLLSTNTGLLSNLSTITYGTLPSTTGSLMSSFSTLLFKDIEQRTASSITRVNFVSSLLYTKVSAPFANGVAYDVTLSTCEFNLQPITRFIDADSKVYLQYNVNYSFRNLQRYISDGNVISVNEFPVSTFLTYNNQTVPNLAFTDYMQFSIYPSTITSTYTQVYSKQIQFELSTTYLLDNNSANYTFVHFHSSLVYYDNKHAESNVFGGIVHPTTFTCDCALVNYTTVEWSNYLPPSTNLKIYVQNGLNYPRF